MWGSGRLWNDRSPDDELRSSGVRWGAIDQWANGIVARGVLLDVVRHRNGLPVSEEQPVTAIELQEIARQQGSVIEPGDALVVHCGRDIGTDADEPWGSYRGDDAALPRPDARAGLHESCLTAVAEWEVSVLVWDMLDALPHEKEPWGLHAGIFRLGLALVDNAKLDDLASICASEGRWSFMLVVAPLVLPGGTGSPVNPIAIL